MQYVWTTSSLCIHNGLRLFDGLCFVCLSVCLFVFIGFIFISPRILAVNEVRWLVSCLSASVRVVGVVVVGGSSGCMSSPDRHGSTGWPTRSLLWRLSSQRSGRNRSEPDGDAEIGSGPQRRYNNATRGHLRQSIWRHQAATVEEAAPGQRASVPSILRPVPRGDEHQMGRPVLHTM